MNDRYISPLQIPFHFFLYKTFFILFLFILLLFSNIFSTTVVSSSPFNIKLSHYDNRYILMDSRGNPTYIKGIVYDPVECGHTELSDIDRDLRLILDAHCNVVRLKTWNNKDLTQRILDIADKYYPQLQFIISFKPYEYSSSVPTGIDFHGNSVGIDWSNPVVIVHSKQFIQDFLSPLTRYSNIWACEIFEDIKLGEYIEDGKYYNGYWNTPSGRNEFRNWLYQKYNGDLTALNKELGLWFTNWADVENNAIYPNAGIIGCGDPWRSIFLEFPAVNFGIWVREISATIRSISSKFLVTGSFNDELPGVPYDKLIEWGLDFPSLKCFKADGKSLLLATAAADLNNKPVLISEWGVQTAYFDYDIFAKTEEKKADMIKSKLLFFASNNRIMGTCYSTLNDQKYLKAPDYGLIDVYGNPKKAYTSFSETNELLSEIKSQLAIRTWDTHIGILLTKDVIYAPISWNEEFINLFDELYRMNVHPCIIGEKQLGDEFSSRYTTIFVISRIYSFGSFSYSNLAKLEDFVERYPLHNLVMLPVLGMFERNASYQEYSEFHSKKLSGYIDGGPGPSNIWNLWGNDGITYTFKITWNQSDLYDKTFSGIAKWHWNNYEPDENSVDVLIQNDYGFPALTVHHLDSGSNVITLYPDVYVGELPPDLEHYQGNRSAHIFTHIILEYLDISHDKELDSISYEIGNYRIASYYPHNPPYDTKVWGSEDYKPVFNDVIGSFKENTSFIAKIIVRDDKISTEASAPATFIINLPNNWEKTRSWLHVLDGDGREIKYQLIGDTIRYYQSKPGFYTISQYQSIPVGIWLTRGLFIFIIIVLVAAWIKTAIWTIKKYGGIKKEKVEETFESLSDNYPFKAYAVITPSKQVAAKSNNWLPEVDEMLKLFDPKAEKINLHGYEYDVISKDLERGVSTALKDNLGIIVGVEVGDSMLVTWSPSGSDVNQAKNGSIVFANKILKQ